MTDRKKMKPAIKAKWVEALRSGEFEQGTGSLCDSDGNYCCLGVLSELAVREGKAEKWLEEDDYTYTFGKKRGKSSEEFVPAGVRKWAGLDSDNPEVPTPDGPNASASLANLNDSGRTFAEIADLIDKHL